MEKEKMKIYVYHWMGQELPGIFQEADWLDMSEENLGKKLKGLADDYDVMFLSPREGTTDQTYRIYLDDKGRRFRQR